MDKILVMVRTSTDVQSIEDQHNEMEVFVLGKGWKKNQIIWVEEQGASAAKVDNTYRGMIDTIKNLIESDSDIKCFAVWHLNRLARTEEVWVEVKTFFVSHGVQVLVKNPELKLLTDDGKVDAGMELAAGLLAILSVQDQLERKEKFARAKKSMASKGLYIGGNIRPYGYKIVDKAYVEDEKESAIVKLIFQLYSTGKYSAQTLSTELSQRGITIDDRKIVRILHNKGFIGEPIGKLGLVYPPIISRELFEACGKIRKGNKLDMKRGQRLVLGAKLIKCYKCGATCTSNSKHYVCCKNSHNGDCDNSYHLRQEVAHSLLWRIASTQHLQYLMNLNENKIEEYNQQLAVLGEKIEAGEAKMADFKGKKKRIVDSYIENLIDKKDRDKKLAKVDDEIRKHQDYMNTLYEKNESIMGLLSDGNLDTYDAFEAALDTMDTEEQYDIIHKHISSLTYKPISYGIRDPRCSKENAVEITITTILGSKKEYLYFPKYYQGCNLYVKKGNRLVKDSF